MRKLTPMMQQYWDIKQNNSDCIIFFRLGDFYEMFFDDAIEISKALNLTLTSRECGYEQKAPMCGIPYHALDNYLPKLIEKGYKIAICEQKDSGGKDIMDREIVKIVTAGTVMEDSMLSETTNNFIVSCFCDNSGAGIAWSDISTGEFYATEILVKDYSKQLQDHLVRISPAEIIGNSYAQKISNALPCVEYGYIPKVSIYSDSAFSLDSSITNIKTQLKSDNLNGFDINNKTYAISASGALIDYFSKTQRRSFSHINNIKFIKENKYMTLDISTRRNLELKSTLAENKRKGSLIGLLDNTKTSMGARNLTAWIEQPLQDAFEINQRYDGIAELLSNQILMSDLASALNDIRDIERLTGKIAYGSITPRECFYLNKSLIAIANVKDTIKNCRSQIIINAHNKIDNIDEIVNLLDKSIVENAPTVIKDGGFIKQGYSADLDNYNEIKSKGKQMLSDLEFNQRETTGIKNLKLGYNRVFGYFYDVTKTYQHLVPSDWERKQTLSNAERYINFDLKQLEDSILSAEDKSINLEINLFSKIRKQLLNYVSYLQIIARAIADLDCLLSLSIIANKYNYTRPEIVDSNADFNIVDGRHAVVESLLTTEEFVPNSTNMNCSSDMVLIITGPNMAGKSTYMRQVALIVLLAHIGSFVPCKSAQIPITDRIFTRVGANDNLAFSQSTFMVEMMEVANILSNATPSSLIILDEVGRGTSTYDGLSIAWSIIEYITKNIKAKTLFSTHYHELTELEGKINGIKNYRITVKEYNDTIIFLRKIVRGGANKSFGIEVAKIAGLPQEVIDNAKILISKLNKSDINNQNLNETTDKADFEIKYSSVIEQIKELDINTCSPLEAINILFDLKEKLKNG